MFKNKKFEVKMMKDEDPKDLYQVDFDQHANRRQLIEDVSTQAIVVIGLYMAADTLRKCAIHTVATKIK